jgi:hypothetical protein
VPEFPVRIEKLHLGVHDVGRFDAFAGFEGLVDDLAGLRFLILTRLKA